MIGDVSGRMEDGQMGGAAERVGVDGPGWVESDTRTIRGLFPLSVERYLNRVVARLAPGVTTVTTAARYYALHGLIADEAQRLDLSMAEARSLLRRSEVVLAVASEAHDHAADGASHLSVTAHAADTIRVRLRQGPLDLREVAKTGSGSYARANWGFMGPYRGSEMTLQIVGTGSRLAPGPKFDASRVRDALSPVLSLARRDTLAAEDFDQYSDLCLCRTPYGTDGEWLAHLFAATDPSGDTSSIRRQTMQMLATALEENPIRTVNGDLTAFVAYNPALLSHDRLAGSAICRQWRGVVFRYESVNAWRSLWEALVERIGAEATVTRQDLRDWLADHVPGGTVAQFLNSLPQTADSQGQPLPAERASDVVAAPQPLRCLKILALGARRHGELEGQELLGFQGPDQDVFEELAPMWMANRLDTWSSRPMKDFAADLVDVLINRSQRIALLKTRFDRRTGRVTIPTRVQVRDDLVYRLHTETALIPSLRWWPLLRMGEQTGLFRREPEPPTPADPEPSTTFEVDQVWRLGARGGLLV